jgi:hypothetical protein
MLSLDTRIAKLETENLRDDFNIDNLTITEFLNLNYFFDKTQVADIRHQLNEMTSEEQIARAERFKELYKNENVSLGGPGGTRTHDQLLKRQLLYRLSYRPENCYPERYEESGSWILHSVQNDEKIIRHPWLFFNGFGAPGWNRTNDQ